MSICSSCGQENPQSFRFCGICGARLLPDHWPSVEERKVVSVLFIDLVGFTARAEEADPEDMHALLNHYHGLVRQEIERFGGKVEKFIGDAIFAVFGVPAHEDDAERAVRAALRAVETIAEMNAGTPGLDLAIRAAVNTGEAVVNLVARREAGEHFITGDVGNTASRLQALAPVGGVVVGETTYQLTKHFVIYQELPIAKVKGKARPVRLWQAFSVRSRYGGDVEQVPSTPFVGREDELDLLKRIYWRAVGETTVQLVLVTGEPGVGKSRIVREFFSFVDAQGELVAWRQGHCLPYGEGITFWALRELIRAETGILESDQPGQAAHKLAHAIEAVVENPSEQEWFRGRLAPLVGLSGDATVADRTEAFTAWRRFLEAVAARRPLVIVIEDLHWADQALLEFLQHLLDRSTAVPLLVVCTARPEFSERALAGGGDRWNRTTIHLLPLSDDETGDLIAALLPPGALPSEVWTQLLERAAGNPLYAQEYVRMLVDHELPESGRHLTRLGGGGGFPVPETIQALIAARLDTLSHERKALLQDAAVIGQVFWAGALSTMGDEEGPVVREALQELARKELIRPARQPSLKDQSEYAFSHGLIRDVAYSQIPRARRWRRHRAAAEWMEGLDGSSAADHAEIVAYHYEQALELAQAVGATEELKGLVESTRRALVLAGDRGLVLDPAQAELAYRKALALSPELPERTAVLPKAAEAARQAGRLDEARQTYEEAIAAFRRKADHLGLGQAIVGLSLVLRHLGDTTDSQRRLLEAVQLLRHQDPSPELAHAYAQMAVDKVLSAQPEEGLAWAEEAHGLAQHLGVSEQATGALGYRGWIRSYLGDVGGLGDLQEALEDALRLGLGYQAAVLYDNLGDVLWFAKGPDRALEVYRTGIEFAERRGITHVVRWIRSSSLRPLFDLGRWDDLIQVSDELIEWYRAHGGSYMLAFAQLYKTVTLVRRGRLEAARPLLEESRRRIEKMGDAQIRALCLTVAALLEQADGRLHSSVELIEDFHRETRDHPGWDRAQHLPDLVRICVAAEAMSLAKALLRSARGGLERGLHAVHTALAVVAEAEGRLDEASRLYGEAATRWGRYGHVLERGQALLGAGRCLLRLGTVEAAASLSQAHAVLGSLGAVQPVAEAEALLAQVPARGS
jgi:class 3 adenylate cyclase/tetratricopeptide (TPR) repeat protein